jgi:hypothetical protein
MVSLIIERGTKELSLGQNLMKTPGHLGGNQQGSRLIVMFIASQVAKDSLDLCCFWKCFRGG